MFLDTANRAELRQGDVVSGFYFPQVLWSSIVLLAQAQLVSASEQPTLTPLSIQKSKRAVMTAQVDVVLTFAMVLSQCCDLEVREGEKRPGLPYIALAPLLDIPYPIATDPTKLEQLRNNSNPLIEDARSFINLFHVPHQAPLPSEKMIDYNVIVSVPISEYEHTLSRKVLQMNDEHRIRLKQKMGYNFGRYTQEERDAGLVPPADS